MWNQVSRLTPEVLYLLFNNSPEHVRGILFSSPKGQLRMARWAVAVHGFKWCRKWDKLVPSDGDFYICEPI